MFYYTHDSKIINAVRHIVFWTSLFAMFGLFAFVVFTDENISQKEKVVQLDLKNKINICTPDDTDQ